MIFKKYYKTMAMLKQYFQNEILSMPCWIGQKLEEQQHVAVTAETFKDKMESMMLGMGK